MSVSTARSCDCFETMREVSRNGFVVELRSTADRPSAPGNSHDWTCVGCETRYRVTPTIVSLLIYPTLAQAAA